MYKEYLPDIKLQQLVECYWSKTEILPETKSMRIFPDGCVDIVFSFSHDNSSDLRKQGLPCITGTFSSYFDITLQIFGIREMIGVRFNPMGLAYFTKTPMYHFTNEWTDLNLIESLFNNSFYEVLPEMETTEERIKHLEKYLINCIAYTYKTDRRILYAVNLIMTSNGKIPIKEVSHKACLSERQFERNFKSVIGLSPKTFHKIIRFRHSKQYLLNNPQESLWSAAIACGYYDDSHMIKDFKQLGGISPSLLIK